MGAKIMISKKVKISAYKVLMQALLVGLLVGIVVGIFRFGIEKMSALWLKLFELTHDNPYWFVVVVVGLILTGVIAGYFVHQQAHVGGSGIPEVKLQLQGKLDIPWWPILWRKLLGGIMVISTGIFLGPEGPSLQLGSTIGQGVGEKFKQSKTNSRILLATGAASGLAAAFGAPLSGVMFVLEEVFHNFSSRVWMNALAGAIAADFVVSNVFGQKAVLAIPYKHTFPVNLYWQLVILGVILGLLGQLYKHSLFSFKKIYTHIIWIPRWLHGLIPLLMVIPIAYYLPAITGPGHRLIFSLSGFITKSGWNVVLLLISFYILRIVFSIFSYDSGLPSGIFLPILAMGAVIGASYGMLMVNLHLMPAHLVVNLIIFSMAGYFAVIIRAPFTAIILITEMVGSLLHLMPLAVVAFVGLIIDNLMDGKPIYGMLAAHMQLNDMTQDESGHEDQITVPVYEGSSMIDKSISQISWPKNTLVKLIKRGSRDIIPNGKTKIVAGDALILVIDEGQRATVYDEMTKLQGFI